MFSATPSDFDDTARPFDDEQQAVDESATSFAETPAEPPQTPGPRSQAKPDFESALEQLQQIVGRLERGSGSLESSLSDFEAGMSLLRSCYAALAHAEQRIELLTRISTDGKRVETEPFDATATFASAESPPEERRPKGRSTRSDSSKAESTKTESAAAKKSSPKKAKPSEPIHLVIKPVETITPPLTEATSVTEPVSAPPAAVITGNAMIAPFDVSPDSSLPNALQDGAQNTPVENTSHGHPISPGQQISPGQPPKAPRSPGNLFEIP